jgi:hypothetical protein
MLIWILVAALVILYYLFVIQAQNRPTVTPTMTRMMSPTAMTRMMSPASMATPASR